jgi:hypothetical protein
MVPAAGALLWVADPCGTWPCDRRDSVTYSRVDARRRIVRITRITYATVAHRQPVRPITMRPHEAGVDDFSLSTI